MELVVDTNILVSFFRENPVRFSITNSKSLRLKLFSPTYALDELKNNEFDILKYSGLNSKEFNGALSELAKFIKIIQKDLFKEFESKAKRLSPHDKDIPFFALALKLNCPIWSNEPAFKKQSEIKIFSTSDLIKELKL